MAADGRLTPDREHSAQTDAANLIINYLPKSFCEADLQSLFEPFGQIVLAKIVRNRVSKESECYGFVKFSTAEEAAGAIEGLNGYQVQGKRLKVAVSVPVSKGGSERANLYCAGFAIDTTQTDLKELFDPHGEVLETRILYNYQTQTSRQCGFVRMGSYEEAMAAIEALHNSIIDKGRLTVRFADKPREAAARKQMRINRQPGGTALLSPQGLLANHSPLMVQPMGLPMAQMSLMSDVTSAQLAHTQPILSSHHQLRSQRGLHQQRGRPQTYHPLQSQQSQGYARQPARRHRPAYGDALLPSSLGGLSAVRNVGNADPYTLGDAHHNASEVHAGVNAMNAILGGGMSMAQYGGPRNAGYMQPVPQGTSNKHPGVCLFVYHLPPTATEADLFQLFSNYGTVLSVKVMKDLQTQQPKGYGFCNIATQVQAELAIMGLNGYRMGNKYLQVSYKS